MKIFRPLAVMAGLAVVASSLIATAPAFAEAKSFVNPIATTPTDDLDITAVDVERTPATMNVTLHVQNLARDTPTVNFYLLPGNGSVVGSNHVIMHVGLYGADGPEPSTVYRHDGLNTGIGLDTVYEVTPGDAETTLEMKILNPGLLPWTGNTWVAADVTETATVQAGILNSGLHGFGPVNDLSIPVTSSIGVSAPAQIFGQNSVTLTASVAPAASGSVRVFDGTTLIGSVSVTEDVPVGTLVVPNTLAIGDHLLRGDFVPASTRYSTGASGTLALKVVDPAAITAEAAAAKAALLAASNSVKIITMAVPKLATKTTVKLSAATQHYKGKRVKATVTVSGKHAGKVRIYDGSHKLTTLALSKGKATYSFSARLSKKKHMIKAVYVPKNSTIVAASTSKKVTLRVVK